MGITESAAQVAPLTHLAGVTHHPWVVPTPGQCVETKFPVVSNCTAPEPFDALVTGLIPTDDKDLKM